MRYDAVAMSDPDVESAIRFLRGHTKADLEFDEHLRPIRYVVGPDGRMIAPVMVAMLEAIDGTIFIPASERAEFEAQVTMQKLDERSPGAGALADRWRIYHGEPQDIHWAELVIEAARFENHVIDGEALRQPNPLAADEAAICKAWNKSRTADLRSIASRVGTIEIEKPILVGIDSFGIDVRARFDVYRIPVLEPMRTSADATRALESMVASNS